MQKLVLGIICIVGGVVLLILGVAQLFWPAKRK
jgi:hypothetical protein